MPRRKPLVLHVAADHSGPYSPLHVTTAVKSLIEKTQSQLDHLLVVPRRSRSIFRRGINSTSNALYLRLFSPFGSVIPAPEWRNRVYQHEIINWLDGRHPDIIHSHKLTYEATIGEKLADHFEIPHVVSIRGSSDTNLRNFLANRGDVYRKILEKTELNLWVSAWARDPMKELTGYVPREKDILFPNAVPRSVLCSASRRCKANTFVSICRLDDYKQKGIIPLLRGVADLNEYITLDLIGPIHSYAAYVIQREINRLKLGDRVRLLGPRSRDELRDLVSEYSAMVLLSSAETFGLVYIEALLAGTPIVYFAGSGVDGYPFSAANGIRCLSHSPDDVAHALREIVRHQVGLRSSLANQLADGSLEFLCQEEQAKLYTKLINGMVGGGG